MPDRCHDDDDIASNDHRSVIIGEAHRAQA